MMQKLICLAFMLVPHLVAAQTAAPAAPPSPAAAQQTPAPAISEADPVTVVRWFYPLRPETAPPPFSQRLQKLQEAADANSRKLNAPVSGLDFAFQVNAQDTEPGYEKTLKIAARRNDGKRARVRVSLRNHRNVELVYELVFENGAWLVDDVRSIREPRWALSRLYINGAREK